MKEEKYNPYCDECTACGEEGCCSPVICQKLKCKYGETYDKDYQFAIILTNELIQEVQKTEEGRRKLDEIYDRCYNTCYSNKNK